MRSLRPVSLFLLPLVACSGATTLHDARAGLDATDPGVDVLRNDAPPSDASSDIAMREDVAVDTPADALVDGPVDATPAIAFPTPIQYIVVLVKENHTFDNYFTGFPGAETTMTAHLTDGTAYDRREAPDRRLTDEEGILDHSHYAGIRAWNSGAMNGFDRNNLPPAGATYDYSHIPFRYCPESQIPSRRRFRA